MIPRHDMRTVSNEIDNHVLVFGKQPCTNAGAVTHFNGRWSDESEIIGGRTLSRIYCVEDERFNIFLESRSLAARQPKGKNETIK